MITCEQTVASPCLDSRLGELCAAVARNKADNAASDTADEARLACEVILASELFSNSPRMCRLLSYLIDKSISGAPGDTSEFVIGLEVFDRNPSTYNTSEDPVVRVQVGRLREKLKAYYATCGAPPGIRISIPLGSYMPVIQRMDIAHAQTMQSRTLAIKNIHCIVRHIDGELFAQGLREELLHHLFRELGNIEAANPYFPLVTAANNINGRDISTHSAENHLLEGSIRIDAKRMRASFRLVSTSLGHVVWSEQFDRDIHYGITQKEELASTVCGKLKHFLYAG